MRILVAVVAWCGWSFALVACGGSVASVSPGVDASGSPEGGGAPDATAGGDGGAGSPDATAQDSSAPGEDSATPPANDAGPCAPPANASQSAICISLTPEAIAFTSDPRFDGKGVLSVAVYDTALPDYPDGGTMPALAGQTYTGANRVDLSMPVPTTRFDGLNPGQVYARAVFVDDPSPATAVEAGYWLAGYDLSNGLQSQTPLMPVTLTAGQGTAVVMDLTALRQLVVTLSLAAGTTPEGNGQGPAVFVVTPTNMPATGTSFFGVGQTTCSTLSGSAPAVVSGLVFGKGPYYVIGALDDFGPGATPSLVPAGSIVSLSLSSSGGLTVPAADALTYAPTAYNVTASVALGLVVPGDAGVDNVSCP